MTEEEFETRIEAWADAGPRDEPGGWGGSEQRRTRSFLFPDVHWIDAERQFGQARNWTLELVKWREGTGFKATWATSVEVNIPKWKLRQDGQVSFVLLQDQTVLHSLAATGFGLRCHGWLAYSWSGELPPELFETITRYGLKSKTLTSHRC